MDSDGLLMASWTVTECIIAVASTCHSTSPPPSSAGYGLVATDAGWYARHFWDRGGLDADRCMQVLTTAPVPLPN